MLNVQTEHLENHTARLTVEVDAEQINQAMRQAARQIAKKARIPGFRPGKAPFNVIVTMFGYDYVLGEALENVGNDIYRQALKESQIEPYAPGSLEEIEAGGQKLTFIVPKQPMVDLGDYRDTRVEYEPIEVTDDMLNRAIERLRQGEALAEEVERPARYGDQVSCSHISVTLAPLEDDEVDEEDEEDEEDEKSGEDGVEAEVEIDETADDESDEDDEDSDEEDDEAYEDDVILHEHDFEYVLYEDPEQEELFPGFASEVVDSVAGNELVFNLDIPEDYKDEDIAGRTLACEVHIDQVYSRIVPEWTDELAQRVSDGKSETLLDLRINTRKELEESAVNVANRDVATKALDQILEGATIKYPEEFVQEYITDLVNTLEENIEQQGLKLQDWLRITGQTENELREQYRQAAVARADRSLVLSEFIRQEQLSVSAEDINAEIERMVQIFGDEEQAAQFRQFFSNPQSRANIHSDMLTNRALDRLAAIAKGENPPIAAPAVSAETEAEAAAEETAEVVEPTAPEAVADAAEAVEAEDETPAVVVAEDEPPATPGETTE
jgi:trigger factor